MPYTEQRSPLLIPKSPSFEVKRILSKGNRRRIEKRGGSPSPLARRLSWTPPPPSPPTNSASDCCDPDPIDTDDMLPPPALQKQRRPRRRQGTPRTRHADSPTPLEVSPPTSSTPPSPTKAPEPEPDLLSQLRLLQNENKYLVSECEAERGSRVASRALAVLQIDESHDRISLQTEEADCRSSITTAFVHDTVHDHSLLESTIEELRQRNYSLEEETEALTEMIEETRIESDQVRAVNDELQGRLGECPSMYTDDTLRKERDLLRMKVDQLVSQMSMMQEETDDEGCKGLMADISHYKEQIGKLSSELKKQTALGETVQDQLVKESTTRWELESELRKMMRSSSEPREGSESSLQTFLKDAEEQVMVLKDDLQKARTSLSSVKAERDAYLTKLSGRGEAGRLGDADIKLAVLKADLSLARDESRKKSLEVARLEEACENLRRELANRDACIDTLQDTLKAQHTVDKDELSMLRAQAAAAEQRVKSAINDAQEKAKESEMEKHTTTMLRDRVHELEGCNAEAGAKIDTLNKRILSLISKHESEMALVKDVHTTNDELKEELKCVTESHATTVQKLKQEQYQTKILNTTVDSLEGKLRRCKDEQRKLENGLDDATHQNEKILKDMTFELHESGRKHEALERELQGRSRVGEENAMVKAELGVFKQKAEETEAAVRVLRRRSEEAEAALRVLKDEHRVLNEEHRVLKARRNVKMVDMSTCSEGLEGLISEVSPDVSEISEYHEEMAAETRRLLRHAEKAIAVEKRKGKALMGKVQEQEVVISQQTKEVRTLKYRLQVLSQALTHDVGDVAPPSPSRFTLASDVSSCTDGDDVSVSSMPSSASALRREIRAHSDKMRKARSPPARTRDTSFQLVMSKVADLNRKHGSMSSSIASSQRSPQRDLPKRSSSARAGGWRQNSTSGSGRPG